MRNIFLLFLFLLLSCAMPRTDNFRFNSPGFENMEEACTWVNQNIKYKRDNYDYWKLPQETIEDKKGDCEDQALLLMGIMNYQKGYQSELLIVKMSNNVYHAIVRRGKTYYDCTSGKSSRSCKNEVTWTYKYDNAMYTARYVKNY